MFKNIAATVTAGIVVGALSTGTSFAAQLWPANVVGVWNAQANQSPLTITIRTQATTGKCRQIAGTILDNTAQSTTNLLGFYCPNSGRIHFLRSDPTTNTTFQDYTGNLSDHGTTLFMGGVFAEVFTPANVGEYSFLASK